MTQTILDDIFPQKTLDGKGLDKILDMTCGLRGMQKHLRLFAGVNVDRSKVRYPTVLADFTFLPFVDNYFETILFDPPFMINSVFPLLGTGVYTSGLGPVSTASNYGTYPSLGAMRKAIWLAWREASRVLHPAGKIILKWGDSSKSITWVLRLAPQRILEVMDVQIHKAKTGGDSLTFFVTLKKRREPVGLKTEP